MWSQLPTKERGPKKKFWWSCLSSKENASSIGQNPTTLNVASRPSKKPFQYYPVRFRNGNESYILLPAFIKSLKSVCSNAGSYDNHVVIKTELQEGLKANNLIYKDENDVEFNWLRDIKWTEVAPGVFENFIMTGRAYITGLCKLEEGIAKKCKINYGEDMPIIIIKGKLKISHAPSGYAYERQPSVVIIGPGISALIPRGSWFSYENIGDDCVVFRFVRSSL